MRRVLASVVPLLAAVLAIAPSAGAMTTTPRVVGGHNATSTDAPWQALVLPNGYLCGGAILDSTHVVTAAHCIYDEDHYTPIAPNTVTVRAGSTNRNVGPDRAVSAIAIDPDYSPETQTNDAAILTLSTALALNGTTLTAIGLTDVGWRPVDGVTSLRLSGWGLTTARSPYAPVPDNPTIPTTLQVAPDVHATSACSTTPEYQPFDDAALLCAGEAGLDACQGDSGGPLAVDDGGAWKLAGIVTGGAGCAWAGYPGYYARVASPSLHGFLVNRGAGYSLSAPAFTSAPAVTGTAKPGQTVTCDPGTYTNAYTYAVQWRVDGAPVDDGDTLALSSSDVGHAISCLVVATGLRGSVQAASPSVLVLPLTGGTPPPTQPPVIVPAPPLPPPVVEKHDITAPTAKVVKVRCARTVCLLDVKVVDPAPSDGVKGLSGSVTTSYRTICKVKKRRKACTRSVVQRLTAKLSETNTYKITTPRMHVGKHVFALYGLDVAGHRQAKATKVTKTTR
ncbi:hypothetical protein DSM104299_01255 [Baekduia alba]|uniref:S1 family serine peptidase n=1 Tax=Baekduia alba TaxID=2997333 RepID=UPI00233FB44D|nr:serine protease [Baekduia alba]WCB92559.1 hypothetical protein DSM104299_01255 [Baekduia alba]